MYVRQTNNIAIQSQNMILEAFIELLHRKPIKEITISKLCIEAKVGRKTFYRNFDTKEDVLLYYIDKIYGEFESDLQNSNGDFIFSYLSFIKKHSFIMGLLQKNNVLHLLSTKFNFQYQKYLPMLNSKVKQLYKSSYVISCFNAIVSEWAKRGFIESIENIIKMISNVIQSISDEN